MESHWEPLGPNLKVLVSPNHSFNTDTLLLAHFSMPAAGQRCADLGTGCGTIPLLWCARGRPRQVLALELQQEGVGLAKRSAEENGFSQTLQVIQGDLREYKALLPHQGLDLMACNPPYFPGGRGAKGKRLERAAARHEETMTLEDLCQAARFSLTFGGRLCFCLPVARLAEAAALCRGTGLEPKRLRLVQLRGDRPPYLFLMECRRGGKPGLAGEPTLLLRQEDGNWSREMREIYGDYQEGTKKSPAPEKEIQCKDTEALSIKTEEVSLLP